MAATMPAAYVVLRTPPLSWVRYRDRILCVYPVWNGRRLTSCPNTTAQALINEFHHQPQEGALMFTVMTWNVENFIYPGSSDSQDMHGRFGEKPAFLAGAVVSRDPKTIAPK